MKKHARDECVYYTKGSNPSLLILSGTHGDEFGVINSVEGVVKELELKLPDFMFIPAVSPSAVQRKTRVNRDEIDINRDFSTSPKSSEVRCIMEIMRGLKFDLCLSFHEDNEFEDFYLYDSLENSNSSEIRSIQNDIRALGVGLYTGCDDKHDPCLDNQIREGYFSQYNASEGRREGTFLLWASREGVAGRVVEPEVPMNASDEIKQQIVHIVFKNLCLQTKGNL